MKNHLVILLFLVASFQIRAQVLDLETCLRMADTANLTIRNAKLDIEINEKQKDVYLAARLPQLSVSGDYKYNAIIPGQVIPGEFFGGPPGTYSTVKFGVPLTLSNTVQLTQILFNPQVNYAFNALKVNAEITKIQQRMVDQDIKLQVASTYFNLQAVIKQLAFVNGNIANMEGLIGNMQAMVQQEMVIQTELDKLQISRLTLINTRESLAASRDQLETYLKILIGVGPSAPITLATDDLVEKPLLVDQSEIRYPEMELIEAQQKMNREERKGTNMSYLPNLSFYAAYNYNYNMKPDDDYRQGIEGAFLGLRLDWVLFDGLEKFHKQKMNGFNAEKLSNQQELVKQQLDLQAADAKRQITVQTNALNVSKEQLELSERVYLHTQKQFSLGTVSSNELILADNDLQQAQTNVVAAFIQLRQAELAYLRIIGALN